MRPYPRIQKIGLKRHADPLYDDHKPVKEGQGFFGFVGDVLNSIKASSNRRVLKSAEKRSQRLEEQVKDLVGEAQVDTLTRGQRDLVDDWTVAKQVEHTIRRRKFLAEAAWHNKKASITVPTHWEERKTELEAAVASENSRRRPAGSRAELYAQEATYQQAEHYSREMHRHALEQRSLDTSRVKTTSTRNFHLEPSLPPSYQARAAHALQNERHAYHKEDREQLQLLARRYDMETTLDQTLSRHRQKRRLSPALLLSKLFNRPYTTYSSPSSAGTNLSRRYYSTPSPSNTQPKPTSGNQDNSPVPGNPDEDEPQSLAGKLRAWFKKNGPLGVTLYLGYSSIDLTLLYLLLSSGADISSVLSWIGIHSGAGAATFALAYAIHKSLAPARAALVVFTIPYAKPTWDRLVKMVHQEIDEREAEIDEKQAKSK